MINSPTAESKIEVKECDLGRRTPEARMFAIAEDFSKLTSGAGSNHTLSDMWLSELEADICEKEEERNASGVGSFSFVAVCSLASALLSAFLFL